MGAGRANRILAHTRSVGVRWPLVYTQRPPVAMARTDNNDHVWEADVLLIYEGLGGVLQCQQPQAWRHGHIHPGRSPGIRGAEGVSGDGAHRA